MSDAILILRAEAFLAAEAERDARSERFLELAEWTAADHAEYDSLRADATRYHERLAEITSAIPTTPAGLIAQAKVCLWHLRHCGEDDPHGARLAANVLRVLGEPVPVWATLAEDAPAA